MTSLGSAEMVLYSCEKGAFVLGRSIEDLALIMGTVSCFVASDEARGGVVICTYSSSFVFGFDLGQLATGCSYDCGADFQKTFDFDDDCVFYR